MPAAYLTFWVLNATADDWESLEQIQPVVNEYWQPTASIAIAEEMMRIWHIGWFEVRPREPTGVAALLAEPLEFWFRMTETGRAEWQALAKTLGISSAHRPQA
jgi:hypothetical protein